MSRGENTDEERISNEKANDNNDSFSYLVTKVN